MTCVESLCVEPPEEAQPSSKPDDPRFRCREKAWDLPSSDKIPYDLNVTQLLGALPYAGLTVQICPSFDTNCEKPLGEVISDEDGKLSLELPIGFRGHLRADPPASEPDLVPMEAFVFPPPSRDPSVPKRPDLVVTQMEVMKSLVSIDSTTLVPGAGHLIFTVIDCNGEPIEGVKVRSSITQNETWPVYVGNGGRPDPALKATGPTGKGAILNVPAKYVKVVAEHPVFGTIFEQSVNVTANKLISVPVVPSPVPKS